MIPILVVLFEELVLLKKVSKGQKTEQSHFNRYSYNLMIFIIWLICGRGLIVPDFSFQKVEAMSK